MDIEGRFDYNSWIESDKGRRLAASLDKDIVLAEGYKEYDTGREYMARMGDWRNNKDEEINLDGIGGVNILVKADVHRSGMALTVRKRIEQRTDFRRHQFPLLCIREPGRDRRLCENGEEGRISSGWSAELCCLGKLVRDSLLSYD